MRHTDKCCRWALLVDTVTHNSASTTQSEAVAWEPLSSTPLYSFPVPSLPALGPWAPPAERGPSLESIYRVSLTADLCEGNNIISLKRIISPQPVAGSQKEKKIRGPWATAQCAHWLRRPCSFHSIPAACPALIFYTQGEVTSQSLWSLYDRHFVGITRSNASR